MYTPDLFGIILAIAIYASLTSATIILTQFQSIADFPQACEDAYNSPISGCDASDFPQKCSAECLWALTEVQTLIENACAGEQASLNTVIGQMFEGTGPQFLCTQDFTLVSSASSGSYSDSASTKTPSASHAAKSSTSATKTTASSSSKAKPTLTTSSTVRRTSADTQRSTVTSESSSDSASTSTSTSTSPSPTSSKSAANKSFLTTAVNNGMATVLSSQAQRTSAANSNPDAFGGGGSPFEVGPNGNGGEKAGADFWLLLSVVFSVVMAQ